MKLTSAVLLGLCLSVSAVKDVLNVNERAFINFQRDYSKSYSANEYQVRKANFFKNLDIIAELNAANPLAEFGINKFSDLSSEEFANMYLIKNFVSRIPADTQVETVNYLQDIPTNFDWSSHTPNPITPVKDQGQCGSCWAFSTTEEVESALILAGRKESILAPQQIVDCDTQDGGCNGGDTITAYEYVNKAGGLELETDYPYKAKNGKCDVDKTKIVPATGTMTYATSTKTRNETELLYALATIAPVSICVDASSWQTYKSGVVTKKCGTALDHCVQLTGYGTTTDTPAVDFWNIRNSWAADWGEKGYIRVERGSDLCGIAMEATIWKV